MAIPSKTDLDMRRMGLTSAETDRMALVMKSSIQGYVPVRTGALRDSTIVSGSPDGTFSVMFGEPYGHMLNHGFKGYIMKHLIGKTVPIRTKDGKIIFRKATAENVGKRRIAKRDPKTGQIMSGNKGISWYHPGVSPMRFAEKGLMASMPTVSKMYAATMINKLIMMHEGKS